jgi:hypothetical protein
LENHVYIHLQKCCYFVYLILS